MIDPQETTTLLGIFFAEPCWKIFFSKDKSGKSRCIHFSSSSFSSKNEGFEKTNSKLQIVYKNQQE